MRSHCFDAEHPRSPHPCPCAPIAPRLERNAARMREKVAALGCEAPRPHVKTSKSIDVLRARSQAAWRFRSPSRRSPRRDTFRQRGRRHPLCRRHRAGEATRSGRADPRGVQAPDHSRHSRCRRRGSRLRRRRRNPGVETLIEIDSDGHRAGVAPGDPLLIDVGRAARRQSRRRHDPRGRFLRLPETDPSSRPWPSRSVRSRSRRPERLRGAGLACPIVSVGSTPTLALRALTRRRDRGARRSYAFGDLVQAGLGTCEIDDIAIGVLASVIGHNRQHGRVLIDAGFLALSRDRGTADLPVDWGYGAVCEPVTGQDLSMASPSPRRTRNMASSPASAGEIDFGRFPIGSRVKVLPNHACATAAAHDRYQVTDGGRADCRRVGAGQRLVVSSLSANPSPLPLSRRSRRTDRQR